LIIIVIKNYYDSDNFFLCFFSFDEFLLLQYGGIVMFIVPISQMPSIEPIQKSAAQVTQPENGAGMPFKQIFEEAINNLRETQAQSNEDAYRLAMGQADDLHTVVINSEKAATALELTVQLTSRAVSAYNEIMRMQI